MDERRPGVPQYQSVYPHSGGDIQSRKETFDLYLDDTSKYTLSSVVLIVTIAWKCGKGVIENKCNNGSYLSIPIILGHFKKKKSHINMSLCQFLLFKWILFTYSELKLQ